MSRSAQALIVVIVVELSIGGWLVARRLNRPIPPQADWTLLDPATADQLRSTVATCQSAEDWRNLGELYMASGCLLESDACHRTACELEPTNAVFVRQWGFALERLALLDQANTQYQRAIHLGIRKPDGCRYLIARNHLRVEDASAARREFTAGQSLAANEYELARLDLRQGETLRAEQLLQHVAESHPTALQVHLLSYRAALARGDERQAAISADQARYAPQKLLNPFDDEARRVVIATASLGSGQVWQEGRDLIKTGRLNQAERMLTEAGQADRSAAVIELLAEIALQQRRFEDALRLFEEFQERNGPSARIMARRGDIWDAAGKPAKAREQWLPAAQLEVGVDLKTLHHKLARSFAAAGDKAKENWHLARGHYYAGRELLQLGRPDQSASYFAKATQLDPAFAQAWFYLGESRRLRIQPQPARAAYESCLGLNPDHGRALAAKALLEE